MSYTLVQSAVQTILRATSELADADVTLADDSILDKGSSNLAIIYPGPFADEHAGQNRHLYAWTVYVDLFQRISGSETTAWASFQGLRLSVISALAVRPNLGQATAEIIAVTISAGDDVQYLYDKAGSGPHYLTQRLRVEVTEIIDLSGGDYA
jgi:hypothetical protein